ncbi:hypothetical protein, partial [Klebsiella pneumoniae]
EKLIAARAARLGMDCPIEITTPEDADRVFGQALPVVPLQNRQIDRPGIPLADNAAGTIEAIERAVEYTLSGRASAVVT